MAAPTATDSVLAEYRAKYPALLTVTQAAEIAQRPAATILDWSSRGRFAGFKRRQGREIRLVRDPFILWLMEDIE